MSESPLLEKFSPSSKTSLDASDSDESFDYDETVLPSRRRGIMGQLASCKALWAVHILLLLINVGFFLLLEDNVSRARISWNVDGVLPYHSTPISMVMVDIAPGGVHNEGNPDYNEYEGRPNPKNEAAWDRLMEVGFTDLDDEEYARLGEETALNTMGTGGHVISISVFHQLHCVNLLRKRIWDAEDNIPQSNHPLRIPHIDQCIDYLREVAMCNGDLTPNTFTVAPDGSSYIPNFVEPHQCRDFEQIFEWAKKRNNKVPIDPPLFEDDE